MVCCKKRMMGMVPAKALLLWEKGRTDLKVNFWHLPK